MFNMTGPDKHVGDWDSLILRFKGKNVHSIQIKVFDVNREGAWEKIKEIATPIIQAVIGKARALIPSAIPGAVAFLTDSLGNAAEDVEAFALKKLAGGGDKVLFRGATVLTIPAAGGEPSHNEIRGPGTKGEYTIDVKLTKS
ncbi:MAG: hypothetical protein IH846_14980 [Acidobacteria bacterium]|nr:hypothetical protein [Acidobacteriota bacterium]